MQYGIRDKVFCKIRGNTIISANAKDFDVQVTFEIIGTDTKTKYLVLIPSYFNIQGSWNIKEEHIEKFNANPNYLDCKAMALSSDRICRVQISSTEEDGVFCINCNEFYPMAEANQPDGNMKCFSCRINPWR